MLVRAPEPVALEDHGEKILGEILRFFQWVSLPTYEQEHGAPIGPAKFSESFARFLLLGARACRGKNQAPACCAEHAPFGQLPRDRFRSHQSTDAAHFSTLL